VHVRATADADIPALHAIFSAAVTELFERHNFAPPTPPADVFELLQRHILATGAGAVAEDDDGAVVAFASAWWRGDDWFLASLFVEPGAQGRGLGSRLLEAVWGDGFLRRRTITDAIQPVSNALYARRGLVPATPMLDFAGRPRPGETTLVAGDGDPAAIDVAAYGFDRAVDHALWRTASACTVWHREGAPVAWSYRLGSTVGPLAGVDAAAAADALDAELKRATEDVRVRMPGTARRLVAVALEHGLRLSPTPGLLLVSEGVRPPDALAIAGYALL
jgi:GNAT superfamily N-acetyltransferase